jgi:hypothetical protein
MTAARQQPLPLRPAGAPAPRPLTPVLPRPVRARLGTSPAAHLHREHDHGR